MSSAQKMLTDLERRAIIPLSSMLKEVIFNSHMELQDRSTLTFLAVSKCFQLF